MTNSKKRCKWCKEYIAAKDGIKTPRGFYCDFDHAAKDGMEKDRKARGRSQVKASKPKSSRAETAAKNAASVPHQIKLTEDVVRLIIHHLDKGKPCISCGRSNVTGWDAGHRRSVGSNKGFSIDPRNIHLQCVGCNRSNYRQDRKTKRNAESVAEQFGRTVKERYGQDLIDYIDGHHPEQNYKVEELKAIRKALSAELRRLENGDEPSRDWRALDYTMRDLIA